MGGLRRKGRWGVERRQPSRPTDRESTRIMSGGRGGTQLTNHPFDEDWVIYIYIYIYNMIYKIYQIYIYIYIFVAWRTTQLTTTT